MPKQSLSHVRDWVFDLDNTLYDPADRLFDQIERRMTAYVMRELGVDHDQADHLRQTYWAQYGTTLAGLMREHDLDPLPYLADVHDIDLSHMAPCAYLAAEIRNLPGRKIVYTNGSAPYAHRVLEARGLGGMFDAVFGVEDADFHPKPDAYAFETVFKKAKITHDKAAMFEDDARNLHVPHTMGLRTIHVAPAPAPAAHIHHHTDDLAAFLARLR